MDTEDVIFGAAFALLISIILCTTSANIAYDTGKESIRREAVEEGVAEMVNVGTGEKQFRWISNKEEK